MSRLKRAEGAEERYLQLFLRMPVGMFVYFGEGGRLQPNPALARMFGYETPEQMTSGQPADLFMIDAGERARLRETLFRDGVVSNFVSATVRLDGSRIWVSIDGRAVISGSTLERMEGIVRDITDEVTTGSELRRTQERFASLVLDAPILFATVDRGLCLTQVAGQVLTELGMEPSELVGQPLSKFLGARPEVMAHFARALAGETFSCPGIIAGRQFQVHYRPVRGDSGAVNGAVMVAVDVTERAQAEEVAELSRERLAWVLSSTPVVLISVDLQGFFNYAAGDVALRVGIDLATEVGQSYQERFADFPEVADWWRRALAGDAHFEEIEYSEHTYLAYFFPLHRDGAPVGAAMVGMDITQRVDAKRQAAIGAKYQAVVIQVGAAALASSNDGQLLQEATVSIARVLDVPLAAAFEIQHELDTATVRALVADTATPMVVGTIFPLSELSSYRTLLASNRAVAVDDFEAQTEYSRSDLMIDFGVKASLTALIPGAERAVGTIVLYSRSPRAWTSTELEFVQIMTNMLSVALQRTRAEEQRRLLLARLVRAHEEERRSIAGDIHDDAVQVMTAANMRLDILRRQLGDAAEVQTVERLQQAVSLSIQRLRHLLFELSPPALERYGLVSALRMALNQLHEESDIEVEIRGTLLSEPDMARRTMGYRVFQEAVANVRRHAHATRVEVNVEEDAGGTTVTITDDGVGFEVANLADPRPGHLGITGMQERMDMAGGRLKITSQEGAGTTVRFWLPD